MTQLAPADSMAKWHRSVRERERKCDRKRGEKGGRIKAIMGERKRISKRQAEELAKLL